MFASDPQGIVRQLPIAHQAYAKLVEEVNGRRQRTLQLELEDGPSLLASLLAWLDHNDDLHQAMADMAEQGGERRGFLLVCVPNAFLSAEEIAECAQALLDAGQPGASSPGCLSGFSPEQLSGQRLVGGEDEPAVRFVLVANAIGSDEPVRELVPASAVLRPPSVLESIASWLTMREQNAVPRLEATLTSHSDLPPLTVPRPWWKRPFLGATAQGILTTYLSRKGSPVFAAKPPRRHGRAGLRVAIAQHSDQAAARV